MFGDLIEMIGNIDQAKKTTAEIVAQRRKKLIELIAQEYPDKKGSVVLFAPVEHDHQIFLQDSTFFYFSSLSEPALTLTFGFNEPTVLYEPAFGTIRAQWVQSNDIINQSTMALYDIHELKVSGAPMATYMVDPYFSYADYQHVITMLHKMVQEQQTIFTLYPEHSRAYSRVKAIVDRLALFVPGLHQHIIDISSLVAQLRRKKDMHEIEQIYQAISITDAAFQAAGHVISQGATEATLQAAIEYIFTENSARPAYPSIVAGGHRATILHYHQNNQELKNGDLVLIDAGAMYGHYCADITRVYPVSGRFTKRQKELYQIVLDTQQLVAERAVPGVWLSNPADPENSLQHIALQYLKKYGYDQYFVHGIGHFLGLDVHDVGGRIAQLQPGDVITIEPGIYIPEEGVGIRIEDNYWILADTDPVCMSEEIVKTVAEVEEMVQKKFEN